MLQSAPNDPQMLQSAPNDPKMKLIKEYTWIVPYIISKIHIFFIWTIAKKK